MEIDEDLDIEEVKFNRQKFINYYEKDINEIIKKIKNKKLKEDEENFEIIDKLIDEQDKIEKEINDSKDRLERYKCEAHIDIIKKYLELYRDKTEIKNLKDTNQYQYYPELTDPEFNKKIIQKKEFYINRFSLPQGNLEDEKTEKGFTKSPSQKFTKNYISQQTPYNGILLWHEVGVGKTCTCIGIAENFVDFVYANKKKILILTPSTTLRETWMDEILNIEKEINKKSSGSNFNLQCTGEKYTSELEIPNEYLLNTDSKTYAENIRALSSDRKKIIEKYYEFMGYRRLAGIIDREYQKYKTRGSKKPEKQIIEYIKDKFSNRVIIMDEVHSVRLGGSSKDKKAIPCLELIARYAENTKLILATATPMYNVSKEIVWLLNLLLWSDKRAPIEEDDIFTKEGLLKDDKKNLLLEKSRGYISYVRGENPFYFPIKLYPLENTYIPNPVCAYQMGKWVKIEEKNKINAKDIIFYKDSLSNWQYKNLINEYKIDENSDDCKEVEKDVYNFDEEEENDVDENISDKDKDKTNRINFKKLKQASNLIVPTSVGGIEIGEQVLSETFNITNNEIYSYKSHVKNIDGESFFHRQNLYQYSAKYFNILKCIQKCQGKVFVYSRFISSGVKGFALALEANGFMRYNTNGKLSTFLEKPAKDKFCSIHNNYCNPWLKDCRQATYIYVDGKIQKTDLGILVKELNGENMNKNNNGEHIKVILGSSTVETGLNFFCIREIHIMDPWFHFSSIEQAVGRGVRKNSHKKLEEEKRNITIYLHCATIPENSKKTVKEMPDEYIYRRAFIKKKMAAEVEILLKKNAVDCALNIYSNYYIKDLYKDNDINFDLDRVSILDSNGRRRIISLFDKDGSIRCGFGNCKVNCVAQLKDKGILNTDTFDEHQAEEDILNIKEIVKQLFENNFAYDEEYLIEYIQNENKELDLDIIYLALDEMIENRERIIDKYSRPGYILDIKGYYIFQPLEITDKTIPILYRYIPNYSKNQYYKLSEDDKSKIKYKIDELDMEEDINKKDETQIDTELILNKLSEFKEDIEKNFSDYPTKYNYEKPLIPSKYLLVCYRLNNYLETLSFKSRNKFIINFINKIINNELSTKKKNGFNEVDIAKMLLIYYDTPKTIPIIIRNIKYKYEKEYDFENDSNIIGDTKSIIGYQTYDELGELYYYEVKDSKLEYQPKINAKYSGRKDVPFTQNDLNQIKDSILGFVAISRKKIYEFFLVNKADGTYELKTGKNDKILKKNDRPGAVCGTASGGKDKIELITIINSLLKYNKYDPSNKTSWSGKEELCLEINLLLRHNDLFNPEVNKETRYFLRIEERFLQQIVN